MRIKEKLLSLDIVKSYGMLEGNAKKTVRFDPIYTVPYALMQFYMALYMKSKGLSDQQIGYLISILFVSSLFFSLLSGAVTDRFGRRKTLFVAQFIGTSLPVLIYIFSEGFVMFAVGYALWGVNSIAHIAWHCFLIEDTSSKARTSAYNLALGFFLCSGIFTPIAGILVQAMGLQSAQKLMMIISFISFTARNVLRYYYGRETTTGLKLMAEYKSRSRHKSKLSLKNYLKSNLYARALIKIIINPSVLLPFVITILISVYWNAMSLTTLCLYFVPFLTEAAGLSKSLASVLGTISSVAMTFSFLFILPRLIGTKRENTVVVSLLLQVFALSCIVLIPDIGFWVIAAVIAVYSVGFQVMAPLTDSMLADASEGPDRSGIYSIQAVFRSLLGALGGSVAGYAYTMNPRILYSISIVILLLLSLLSILLSIRNKHRPALENIDSAAAAERTENIPN